MLFRVPGVHCWVCDTAARRLNNEQRCALAELCAYGDGGQMGFGQRRVVLVLQLGSPLLHTTVPEALPTSSPAGEA